ncbi:MULTISPECIES: hypothetical protein [Metallosphaera]|nr:MULTISPECIES: hypothetical protein [Metallosphaera]AKV74180.1 hypothetical protein MsedA_1164 [Metallosphaera sedula]AKV76419.1 hypothetical protein MsedB_1166 [Metallosphaera sedula]AKV78671.1 hypothetical protein MsedC_1164 [Metallosphaera sedula]AKV80916.1 hypothetical protein MsedD_1165 [Metallosphaera sedula]AKV83159.1 hypothetical protein MsedE_1167 [Metallosphaera sedula]
MIYRVVPKVRERTWVVRYYEHRWELNPAEIQEMRDWWSDTGTLNLTWYETSPRGSYASARGRGEEGESWGPESRNSNLESLCGDETREASALMTLTPLTLSSLVTTHVLDTAELKWNTG